jgi:rRNA-processing protein FCF1
MALSEGPVTVAVCIYTREDDTHGTTPKHLPNGRWRIQVYLGRDPNTRRHQFKCITRDTLKEAQIAISNSRLLPLLATFHLMRVLLDTNVVLTGALRPASPAGKLASVRDTVTFSVTDLVMHECRRVLREAAGGRNKRYHLAVLTVDAYLKELGALLLPDNDGPRPPPKADLRIHAAAQSYGCDAICTYNPSDFPEDGVPTISPLGLRKQIARTTATTESFTLEQFIQVPILGNAGTLFFMGTLHHPSSMGNILEAGNGLRFVTDGDGYIRVSGTHTHVNVTAPLGGTDLSVFFLRYTSAGQFKASLWLPPTAPRWTWDQGFQERVLTTGQVPFAGAVRALLGDGSFAGVVIGYSGVPHYVRDNMIPHVIRNQCLEAVWGSADIAALLQACVVGQTPDDRFFLGLPRY